MALALDAATSPTALSRSIRIHGTQLDYSSLLLATGYDNAYCLAPALSYVISAQAQRYFLPYPSPPLSVATLHSPEYNQSVTKKERRTTTSNCKLVGAIAVPQATSSKNKLGRSYNPGRPLAMEERQKILHLYKKGHKISHIARIIGVTHSCVSKIMTRYRRTGSMQPRSTCSLKKKNLLDCGSAEVDVISVLPHGMNTNCQKLCRSCSADATLSGSERPSKSYSIQRPKFIIEIRILRRGHGWVRDWFMTSDRWCDRDFMLHGWKRQNISDDWQSPFEEVPNPTKCDKSTAEWRWRNMSHVSVEEVRKSLSSFELHSAKGFPKQARLLPYLEEPDVGECYPNCDNLTSLLSS